MFSFSFSTFSSENLKMFPSRWTHRTFGPTVGHTQKLSECPTIFVFTVADYDVFSFSTFSPTIFFPPFCWTCRTFGPTVGQQVSVIRRNCRNARQFRRSSLSLSTGPARSRSTRYRENSWHIDLLIEYT